MDFLERIEKIEKAKEKYIVAFEKDGLDNLKLMEN
jgi:hypothetical protein